MKNLILRATIPVFGILFVIYFIYACNEESKKQPLKEYSEKKVVKAKKQAQETSYHYKYNFWKGNFYHQPDIHTVNYIVYTDGSYDRVDIGKFTITNIGDTIIKKHYR